MKAISIGRLAIVAGGVVAIGAYGVLAVAQDSVPVSRLEADKLVHATGFATLEAVTSDELDRTNGSDPISATLPIPTSEARGADLSLEPLNTAPTSVMFRLIPTAISTAN